MENRVCLIFKRWMSILVYAVLGTGISAIIIEPLLAPWVDKVNPENALFFVVILIFSLLFIGYKLGLFHVKHLAFTLYHPPCWLGAVAALIYLIFPSSIPFLSIFFIDIVIVVLLYAESFKPPVRPKVDGDDMKKMTKNITEYEANDLLSWANREKPLEGEGLLFGREQYVRRIYNRLFSDNKINSSSKECEESTERAKDKSLDEPKSFALLGELGSGKSSVINAVLYLLKQRAPEWLPVKVDAWARDAKTIDEQILDLIIDKIGEVTDVTAYKNVPSAYRDALKSHGNWWATLSHLMAGTASTESKLKRIDNLLSVLNKKIIIIIEDPDRGIDKERCCERVFALLDRLQQHTSTRIKIIVTGGESLLNGDLRVIEFKETLNTPAKEFAAILNTISDKLWGENIVEGLPDIIFPDGKPAFTFKDFPFGTPRDVKHVIRDVHALWVSPGELRGEINLKQLVLLNLLKERGNKSLTYLQLRLNEIEGDGDRNFYCWAGRRPPRHEVINESKFVSKFEDNNENIDDDKKESKSISYRCDLSASENTEITYWIKMIANCGKYQVVHSAGRHNYFHVFNRHFSSFDDVDDVNLPQLKKLKPYEGKSDQTYLKAMSRVFKCLKNNKELDGNDVSLLICTGQLSPYLYDKMESYEKLEGEISTPLDTEKWCSLANKIIEVMPGIDYTKNKLGHPASKHLFKIIFHFYKVDAKKLAEFIIRKVFKSNSSAGLYFLSGLLKIDVANSVNADSVWWIYKVAFKNEKIFPNEIDVNDSLHWIKVYDIFAERIHHIESSNDFLPLSLNEDDMLVIRKIMDVATMLIEFYDTYMKDTFMPAYNMNEEEIAERIDKNSLNKINQYFESKLASDSTAT